MFKEYYNLANDPAENSNLLKDGDPSNDPSQAVLNSLAAQIAAFATCAGSNCVK
jgi:hypothetical protein